MRSLTALLVLMVAAPILGSEDVVLTGQVVAIEHGPAERGDVDVLGIRFRTRNEEQVHAHLCPEWFLETDLEETEEMTLRGRFDDEGGFRVREMVRNEVRRQLRDEDYEPLWLRTRLQQRNHFYNPHTERPMKCKITEIYVDEPSSMMEAQVRLENREQVRLRFAPEWYLRKNLRLGDELELRGSEVGSGEGAMVLVREMRNLRTRREVTLRNREGFPMWRERSRERERERLRRGRMEEEGRRGQENGGRHGPR